MGDERRSNGNGAVVAIVVVLGILVMLGVFVIVAGAFMFLSVRSPGPPMMVPPASSAPVNTPDSTDSESPPVAEPAAETGSADSSAPSKN